MARPRLLGVLLCYNDGDILADALDAMLNNGHDVVVWNHGSTDETASVLRSYAHDLLEMTDISRDVDFYDIYPLMSKHLLAKYVPHYDWISWPDQDEVLEGPARTKSYREYLEEAVASRHSWIEFNDYVYWFTTRDDSTIASPCARVRHYSLARHGPPKIRSWRASSTNIRWFNHNKTAGSRHPALFNLRHYPMRSAAQMHRRISVDRANLQHGPVNFHYENMKAILPTIDVQAESLHYDDGVSPLNSVMKFNWSRIYGTGPKIPRDVTESYMLPTRRWEIAGVLKQSLATLPADAISTFGSARIDRWLRALDDKISCPIVLVLRRDDVKIVTETLSAEWAAKASLESMLSELPPSPVRSVPVMLGSLAMSLWVDTRERVVRLTLRERDERGSPDRLPLVALVPCYGGDEPRVSELHDGAARFEGLRANYYYLTSEPEHADAPVVDRAESRATQTA